MWVDSEVTKGSKFYFTITSRLSEPALETVLTKIAPFHGRTILLFNSNGTTATLSQQMLDLGLSVHIVNNIDEAAAKDSIPHVDAIITDSLTAVSPHI